MKPRVNCTFKLRQEELDTLDLVASELSMTRSELIRDCINMKIKAHLKHILKEIKQCN